VVASAIALVGVTPALAQARGWKVQVNNRLGTGRTHMTGTHCGKTKFGTWSFKGTMTLEGKVARLRWSTRVTKDGAPHPTSNVRVTGTAPASAKTTLRQTFSSITYRYEAGSTPKLRTQMPDGSTFSTLTFRPKSTKHC
jgi:hypothetical protein